MDELRVYNKSRHDISLEFNPWFGFRPWFLEDVTLSGRCWCAVSSYFHGGVTIRMVLNPPNGTAGSGFSWTTTEEISGITHLVILERDGITSIKKYSHQNRVARIMSHAHLVEELVHEPTVSQFETALSTLHKSEHLRSTTVNIREGNQEESVGVASAFHSSRTATAVSSNTMSMPPAVRNVNQSMTATLVDVARNPRVNPATNHGIVAEYFHAETFNMNAVLRNSPLRAKVIGGANGPIDIQIKNSSTGKVVKNIQVKSYKTAAGSRQAMNTWSRKHGESNPNTEFVVSKGQNVKGASTKIAAGDVESIPITHSELLELQSNPSEFLQKHDPTTKFLRNDVVQVGIAAGTGAAVGFITGAFGGAKGAYDEQWETHVKWVVDKFCLVRVFECLDPEDQKDLFPAFVNAVGEPRFGPNWLGVLQHGALEGTKSAVVGAVAGGSLAGLSMALNRGAAACIQTAPRCSSALTGASACLGFTIVAAQAAYELSVAVYKLNNGDVCRRTAGRMVLAGTLRAGVGAGLCGIAFIPVAGMPLAIIGGLAFATADIMGYSAEALAEYIIPISDEEIQFNADKMKSVVLKHARDIVGVQQGLSAEELKRKVKKWLLKNHPDKNNNVQHKYHHQVMLCFILLINEATQGTLSLPEVQEIYDPLPIN